jgi:glutaredoxin
MNWIESLLLSTGMSWQMTKFLPIILLFLLSVLVFYFLWKKTRKIKFKLVFFIIAGLLPCSIYFALYPIYQSDIKNEYRVAQNEFDSLKTKSRFEIVSLPNCPYCISSINLINQFKKRNPNLSIEYKIVSLGSKEGKLESQLKKAGLKYSMIRSGKKLGHLVKGSYPTYLFYHKGNIQIWNNNSFGTKALDFIESELN